MLLIEILFATMAINVGILNYTGYIDRCLKTSKCEHSQFFFPPSPLCSQ